MEYFGQVVSCPLPAAPGGQTAPLNYATRVTLFEFCRDFQHQKTRVPRLWYAIVCMILRFNRTLTCDRQTDRHMTTANTGAS